MESFVQPFDALDRTFDLLTSGPVLQLHFRFALT